MIGSNKILTVSYGTFSCTLEGFDDSFSTMKAIAEYFRDLAADDRYFGAEPPTPDADMLARIAEKEILRRVEARTNGKDIVLRASDDRADAQSESPSDSAHYAEPNDAPSHASPSEDHGENSSSEPLENNTVSSPESEGNRPEGEHQVLGEAASDKHDNSVSAKLARIKAVVDQERLYMHPTDSNGYVNVDWDHSTVSSPEMLISENPILDEGVPESLEDEGADNAVESFDESHDTEASESKNQSEHQNDDTGDQVEGDGRQGETPEVSADDNDSAADHSHEETTNEAHGENDSDRDEGGEHEDQVEDTPETSEQSDNTAGEDDQQSVEGDHSEPEHAESDEQSFDQDSSQVEDEAHGHLGEQNDISHSHSEIGAGEDVVVIKEEHERDNEPQDRTPEAEIEVKTPEVNKHVPRIIRLQSAASPISDTSDAQSQDESSEHRDEILNGHEEVEAVSEISDLSEPEQNAEDASDLEYYDEDYSVAALDGVDELTEHLEGRDQSDFAQPLQPLDEAELQEELADVERDIAQTPIPKRVLPEANDEMLSRISTQTNKELDESEGSERRSTFSHLKAAVNATKAALKFGEPAESTEKQETPFRDDLERVVTSPTQEEPDIDGPDMADEQIVTQEVTELEPAYVPKQTDTTSDRVEPQIVRPRRPVRAPESSGRPRSEPFKLVESQRIDVPHTEKGQGNVLPRRVTRTQQDSNPSSGFAQFAAHSGARELPDLLEAAAAYVSFVEGADNFSRPQIMRQVQDVSEEEFSREEGLRHFGTLLREGRISKSQNGRFEVSKDTRFKPELHAS